MFKKGMVYLFKCSAERLSCSGKTVFQDIVAYLKRGLNYKKAWEFGNWW